MTTLSDLGITPIKSGLYATTCPNCSHLRKPAHKKNPCLTVNNVPDNEWYNCHNCSFSGNLKSHSQYATVREKSKMPAVLPDLFGKDVSELLAKKQISPQTAKLFGCYERPSPGGALFCMPYYEGHALVNVCFRRTIYNEADGGQKFFFLKKDDGAKTVYWGMQLLDLNASKEVTIVEGQFDAMTHFQCGKTNILSVPNGAPSPDQKDLKNRLAYAIDPYIIEKLNEAEKIYLFTDGDGNGMHLRELLAKIYGKKRCWVYTFPKGYKDSNEIYAGDIKKGLDPLGKTGIDKMYELAQPYPISGTEISIKNPIIQEEMDRYASGGYDAGLYTGKTHYDDLFRVRNGILIGVTGIPSFGKSTFFRDWSINLCKNNPKIKLAGFTPEMRPLSREFAKMIESLTGKTLIPNRSNTITAGERSAAEDFIHTHYRLIKPDVNGFADVYGKIDPKTIGSPKGLRGVLLYFKLLRDRYGINGFWIDAWNKLDHQATPIRQTIDQYISQELDYIHEFLEKEDLFGAIIAHPTKMTTGRGGNIIQPTLYDMKGGSPWFEKLDIGLVTHRTLYKKTDKKDENGDEIWVLNKEAPMKLTVQKMKFDELGELGGVNLVLDKTKGQLITEHEQANSHLQKKSTGKQIKLTSSVDLPNSGFTEEPEEKDDDEFQDVPF